MADYFCGLDVGGTSSRAVISDAAGERIGWGYAKGGNPTHAGWENAEINLRLAADEAIRQAEVSAAEVRSVFLGMSGVISAADRERAAGLCTSWGLAPGYLAAADHDLRIALSGGLSGRPGIALIAGTGSSCYGHNARGESWQAGGWTQLLDDMGSGYDLARRGMAAVCQSGDGRLQGTRLPEVFFEQFQVETTADFVAKGAHLPRHQVASLAPLVLRLAEEGDVQSMRIVRKGAEELARMVVAVARNVFPAGDPEVVFIGSLVEKSALYAQAVREAITRHLPAARFTAAEFRPAAGAWLLAAAQAGVTVDSSVMKKISRLAAP